MCLFAGLYIYSYNDIFMIYLIPFFVCRFVRELMHPLNNVSSLTYTFIYVSPYQSLREKIFFLNLFLFLIVLMKSTNIYLSVVVYCKNTFSKYEYDFSSFFYTRDYFKRRTR